MNELVLRNRQRGQGIDLPLLRQITLALLGDLLRIGQYEVGICLVNTREITRLNMTYLRHDGPTDIITFDYLDAPQPSRVHGDLFICVPAAVEQARAFKTTWPAELTRYVVHGVLHLLDYNDLASADRRRMKRQENRLLKALAARYPLPLLDKQRCRLPSQPRAMTTRSFLFG